jgi:pyruvate dehydrogenase E2 component (dihydrolipoamide acetyltransferase)
MGDFRMPSLGADMEAGTLVEWRALPGSRVKRGDIVALVETQKGIVEVEIWESGIIDQIRVQPGTKVPVGTILATLREEAGAAAAPKPMLRNGAPPAAPAPRAPAPAAPTANGPSAPVTPVEPAPLERPEPAQVVRASPAARQLARERGVDLATVRGTGPHGAVTRDDVEHARVKPAVPEPTRPSPLAPAAAMRKAIAGAMARSKREIPHYYLGADLDVARAVRWLEAENDRRPVTERILFAALLLKATALGLRDFPDLNGFYIEDAFRPSRAIHVGVAIALRQGGLVAPAIHDTDAMPLGEIMAKLKDLTARVRAGSLKSSEMSDPTVTVTSLGEQGTDVVFGVIYPPQVALVGFGSVRERPWAEGGMLGVRPVVTASLAGDHRVSDGHRGARFLAAIGRLLSEPEKL